MSEQELRDYVRVEAEEGRCIVYDSEFNMHIVVLNKTTIAMSVTRGGLVVSEWGIYTYAHAANVLAWACAGGDWKDGEVGE